MEAIRRICEVLLVVFIGMKLFGLLNWPWLWVLSPMWIPLGALAALFVWLFFFHIYKAIRISHGD